MSTADDALGLITDYAKDLVARRDLLLQVVSDRDAKIAELETAVESWRNTADNSAEAREALRAELAAKDGRIADLERTRQNWHLAASQRQHECEKLREQVQRLGRRCDSTYADLERAERERCRLGNELGTANARVMTAENDLMGANQAIQQLERQLSTHTEAVERNRVRAVKAERERGEFAETAERLRKELVDSNISRQRAEELLTYFKGRVEQHFNLDFSPDKCLNPCERQAVLELLVPAASDQHRAHRMRRAAVVHNDVEGFACECGFVFNFHAGVVDEAAKRVARRG
jgi:chromosome segregation ATPase